MNTQRPEFLYATSLIGFERRYATRRWMGRDSRLVIALLVWGIFISYGGLVLVLTIPFALCSAIALLQQLRMRPTSLGFSCVIVTSIPMIASTIFAIAYLPQGGGYYMYALLMLVAMSTIVVDVVTRWHNRHVK